MFRFIFTLIVILLFTCIFIYTSMSTGMWQSNDVVFVTQVSVATQLYILLHVYVLIFIMLALNYCSFFFNWIYHPIQWIHLISILAYIFNWGINFNRIIQGDCFAWIISYFPHLFWAFSFCHFRRAYTGSPICMVPLLSRAAFTPNIGSSPYGGMQRNLKRKIESEK